LATVMLDARPSKSLITRMWARSGYSVHTAYELDLPAPFDTVYPVFHPWLHLDLSKKEPAPILDDDAWEVKEVVDSRIRGMIN
jgi:hypothetical protein